MISDAFELRISMACSTQNSDTTTLIGILCRFPSAEMNREYLKQVLVKLLKEAKVRKANKSGDLVDRSGCLSFSKISHVVYLDDNL